MSRRARIWLAVGLYLGSTSGTIWHSRDEGRTWKVLAEHLPHLFSLTIVAPGRIVPLVFPPNVSGLTDEGVTIASRSRSATWARRCS